MTKTIRVLAAGVAVAVGLTGAAQAEPFNIWSASQADSAKLETVKHRHGRRHRHHGDDWRKAAIALGAIGAIAGAAAAASHDRRYYYDDDDYYYYDEPRRYYYEGDCDVPNRPAHYPAPPGC